MRNYFAHDDGTVGGMRKRRRRSANLDRASQQQPQCRTPPTALPGPRQYTWSAPDSSHSLARAATETSRVAVFAGSAWTSMTESAATVLPFPTTSSVPSAVGGAWNSDMTSLDLLFTTDHGDKPLQSLNDPAPSAAPRATCVGQPPSPPLSRLEPSPSLMGPESVSALPTPGSIGSMDLDLVVPEEDGCGDGPRHAEQLSEMSLDLFRQLRRIVGRSGPTTLRSLTVAPSGAASPLEDILNSTRLYVDILSVAVRSIRPSSSSYDRRLGPAPSRRRSRGGTPDVLADYNSSSESSDFSDASTPSGRGVLPKAPLDTATVLLILTCYIYLLRLHVALFNRIQRYLQDVAESDEHSIGPIPGLGGFGSLAVESGNLQATMLIQLVTNMFEKIEALLGLPQELRIGRRPGGQEGLLINGGFLDTAAAMIRKEDIGRPEEGKGGIRSLRRDMRKARRLLRSHIAP
ncbi:hypothetical protein GQ53DRAFT_743099 [Thozetella sp. PMI_491]|nr:hypothetical protein GQ53DRAFT_743099 [Thozetella sp. PMI_491]